MGCLLNPHIETNKSITMGFAVLIQCQINMTNIHEKTNYLFSLILNAHQDLYYELPHPSIKQPGKDYVQLSVVTAVIIAQITNRQHTVHYYKQQKS